jgi:hypothetical protein
MKKRGGGSGKEKTGGMEWGTERRKWERERDEEINFCSLILSNRTERSGQEFPRLDSSNRTSHPEASGKEPHTYVYNPKEYASFFFIYPTL